MLSHCVNFLDTVVTYNKQFHFLLFNFSHAAYMQFGYSWKNLQKIHAYLFTCCNYIIELVLLELCRCAFKHKYPNCLCGLNTRLFELLLWRIRPNILTYLQDCTIFFIQLNNVKKLKNKVLPSYINSPVTRWHITGKRGYWAVAPCCPELYFKLSLENCLIGTRESYGPTAQHVCKTLYKSQHLTITNKLTTHEDPGQNDAQDSGAVL